MELSDMQLLWEAERRQLLDTISVQAEKLRTRELKNHWKAVDTLNTASKSGLVMANVYAGVCLLFAFLGWAVSPAAAIICLVAAAGMIASVRVLPYHEPPSGDLGQYTLRELQSGLHDYSRLMRRRSGYDFLIVVVFCLALFVGMPAALYGIDIFSEPEKISATYIVIVGGGQLLSLLLAGLGLGKHFRELRETEALLREWDV